MQCKFTVAETSADLILIKLAGVLDIATSEDLEPKLLAAMEGVRTPLVIDLTEVEFISSRALGIIVRLTMQEALSRRGTVLVIAGGEVEHAIRAARLDTVVRIAESMTLARVLVKLPPLTTPRSR